MARNPDRVPIEDPIMRIDDRTGYGLSGSAGQVVRRYPSQVVL
jgi:hypothetical protein